MFSLVEGQNYTLLNFVNYQHNEAEAIRRQISQVSVNCACVYARDK